jgi:cytochrome c peroxidase
VIEFMRFHVRFPIRLSAWLLLAVFLQQSATAAENDVVVGNGGLSRAFVFRRVEALRALGAALFSDPALSASGRQSCASCHGPEDHFAPDNALAVQSGGADMQAQGLRAVPTLTYKQATPPFTEHFHESDDEGDESVDNGPTGGLTWDGGVDRLREQAMIPLLSPTEMANRDPLTLGATILARYGDVMAALPGGGAKDVRDALQIALDALAAYQESPDLFFPYTSKYDDFLAGKAVLTAQESRGLALFEDVRKGNCATCHISRRGADGSPPQFTDDGFIAIGVPRNATIAANRDPAFFDLGLCGPERRDLRDRPEYCGLFKTPTLRNVATRRSFFHNGAVHDLRDAVAFYVERETKPEKWYPRGSDGAIVKYDDLPARFHANLNQEPPFDRKAGEVPALSDAEIDDVVAFLRTLTDGYKP